MNAAFNKSTAKYVSTATQKHVDNGTKFNRVINLTKSLNLDKRFHFDERLNFNDVFISDYRNLFTNDIISLNNDKIIRKQHFIH